MSFAAAADSYRKGLITKDTLFEAFEEEYRKRIVSFLYAITAMPEKVEDIYQEFLIKVSRKIDDALEYENFDAWLLKVARNLTVDFFRKQKPKSQGDEVLKEQQAPGPGPKTENIQKEIHSLLNQALNGIKPEYREVVFLKFYLKQTFEEISALTGTPVSTVKYHFQQGMSLLENIMKSLMPE